MNFKILMGAVFSIGLLGCIYCVSTSSSRLMVRGVDSQPLVDLQGKLSPQLLQLLSVLGVEHNGTLESVVAVTQKAWLRPAGKERWEMEKICEDKRAELMPIFESLGFVNEITPRYKQYDYVLVMGALAERVRTRIAYLKKQWEHGVRFDNIIFLGGDRPLQLTGLESPEILLNRSAELPARANWVHDGALPATELEMMQFIMHQADVPQEWNALPQVWVKAPMKQGLDGKLLRPTTEDTIKEWLAQNPKPGRCLVISNQPYVPYQACVAASYLPSGFEIDAIGKRAEDNYIVALYLDTIARTLYQENIKLQRTNSK